MRNGLRRAAAVLLAAGVGVVAVPAALATTSVAATTATAKVSIVPGSATCTSLFCFKPPFLKVAASTTVTWTNMSSATHTITRCTPAACSGRGGGTGTEAGFGTSGVTPNHHYSFTFTSTGTYVYYCAIHGYKVMHGTVSVH